MVITEVTELSFEYATLDAKGVRFLQTYFRGAKALVATEQGQRTVPVTQLRPRDNLSAIVDIPATLKIAKVVEGMSQFMEQHGLLEFKVNDPAPETPAVLRPAPPAPPEPPLLNPGSEEAKKRSAVKIQEVKRFLDTIEHAQHDRTKASSVVEEMLDHGRAGDYSSKGVEAAVDEIVQKGSSPAMKAIAGLRGSDQTYAHCTDMSVILADCYVDVLRRMGKETSDGNRRFVMISGFMHDIGKSEVPKDILESTTRFSPESREMQMMRNHTTYGARILSEMGMHAVTINVAHYHHVKKDTTLFTSYPSVSYDEVLPITRLASIVDVYQALIGKRKYKKNWVPGKAIEYVMKLKGSEFDEKMLDHFVESMGIYPVGSLVRLSTNELAFVLMLAPKTHPDRPIVAVVENASGEVLTHHTLLDLMLEPDIRVEEVVDHYEHYNQSEDQAYQIFQSIRVGK
jgi:HD-GYP domain-containing protein (c-di-GMP phosphodiesterase class II)